MRVAYVTPSRDLAAKCHLKREREVYKHVLTLAFLDKTCAGKKTMSMGSKVKALFLEKGERGHPMCGLFVKTFPFLRSILFLSLPPAPVCFCCERGSGTIGVLEVLFPFPKCTFFILIYLHQAGAAD